jgi:hypothetical protein
MVRRVLVRSVLALTMLTAVALAAPGPADAGSNGFHRSSAPSVFPQPRDPYRSWGVRHDHHRRIGVPHSHGVGRVVTPHHEHDRVWIPGHWAWNGAAWVWWPGHWGIR